MEQVNTFHLSFEIKDLKHFSKTKESCNIDSLWKIRKYSGKVSEIPRKYLHLLMSFNMVSSQLQVELVSLSMLSPHATDQTSYVTFKQIKEVYKSGKCSLNTHTHHHTLIYLFIRWLAIDTPNIFLIAEFKIKSDIKYVLESLLFPF